MTKQISELTAATALASSDVLAAVDGSTTKKATVTVAAKAFGAAGDGNTLAALPNLMAAVTAYNDSSSGDLAIMGLGSSVGLGQTLASPSTNAPSAYFRTALDSKLNRLGNITWEHDNASEAGTALANSIDDFAAALADIAGTLTVVTVAYGMNDGNTDLYHNGQTLPGVRTFLLDLIAAIREQGADPVVFTSPHPHTERQTWGASLASVYPAAGVFLPDDTTADSIVTITLPSGEQVPASYRHLRVNEVIRRTCADQGVTVIDAERCWFDGVAEHGEDALFDVGETVHPNLLGHQVSYHRAIDHWAAGLDVAVAQATTPPDAARTWDQEFNVQDETTITIALDDHDYGILLVEGRQPAFDPVRHASAYLVLGAATTRVTQLGELDAGGTDLFTVSASGANITITPAFDGVDLRWTLTKGLPLA